MFIKSLPVEFSEVRSRSKPYFSPSALSLSIRRLLFDFSASRFLFRSIPTIDANPVKNRLCCLTGLAMLRRLVVSAMGIPSPSREGLSLCRYAD